MTTCSKCLAMSIGNSYPPGFCPLGYEVVRMPDHTKAPKGDCPNPKTHAEMIELYDRDELE